MAIYSNLTQEELLHLAIESIKQGDHGVAISYLKEGVEKFADDPKIAYVLGAEYAQIGMFEKAESEMRRAIELDPSLHTASFHLGLMLLTQGRNQDAAFSWEALNALPETHCLWLFKTGLNHMVSGENMLAKKFLEEGIQANDFSPELTRDMQMVLAELPEADTDTKEVADTVAGQGWLNAYGMNKSE
jgi:tetratricopeptide (TPR) repeat protein